MQDSLSANIKGREGAPAQESPLHDGGHPRPTFAERDAHPRTTLRVLVADDEQEIADTMVTSLRYMGYQCDVAYDGREALTLFERHQYALIISDIAMPALSGIQLYSEVCQRNYDGSFIFVSGYSIPGPLQKLVDSADAFFQKPFSLKEMFDTIKRIL